MTRVVNRKSASNLTGWLVPPGIEARARERHEQQSRVAHINNLKCQARASIEEAREMRQRGWDWAAASEMANAGIALERLIEMGAF